MTVLKRRTPTSVDTTHRQTKILVTLSTPIYSQFRLFTTESVFSFADRGAVSNKLPPSAIGGLIAGLLIVALLIICLVVLSYINKQKRRLKRGVVSGYDQTSHF